MFRALIVGVQHADHADIATHTNPLTIFDVLCYLAAMDTTTLTRLLPLCHKYAPCCGAVEAPSLTQAQTDRLAACLKVLGDPTRLRILDLLARQPAPLCVCDLTPQFSQDQPTISHHLRLLREAGLIDTEKQGIWAYYWATDAGQQSLAPVASLA